MVGPSRREFYFKQHLVKLQPIEMSLHDAYTKVIDFLIAFLCCVTFIFAKKSAFIRLMREERHVNCNDLSIHEIHLNVPNNILQQLDAVLYGDIFCKRKKCFWFLNSDSTLPSETGLKTQIYSAKFLNCSKFLS